MLHSVRARGRRHPDGEARVLLAIDECVNGTGGCAQSFVLWRRDNGAARAAFLDSLNHRFPGAVRQGYHVNLGRLRASAALYSSSDANRGPSRVAEMRLRLRGAGARGAPRLAGKLTRQTVRYGCCPRVRRSRRTRCLTRRALRSGRRGALAASEPVRGCRAFRHIEGDSP